MSGPFSKHRAIHEAIASASGGETGMADCDYNLASASDGCYSAIDCYGEIEIGTYETSGEHDHTGEH